MKNNRFILFISFLMIAFLIPSFTACESDQAVDSAGNNVTTAEDGRILSDDSSDFVLISDVVPDAIRIHSLPSL